MHVVIIGGSFAGIACALHTRKLYPQATITLIERERELAIYPNSLWAMLKGEITTLAEGAICTKQQLLDKQIHVYCNESFVQCLAQQKLVKTSHDVYTYDKLVLAMGSTQISETVVSEEIQPATYKTLRTAALAQEQLIPAQEVTVIGAGQAGLEAAYALVSAGKKVNLIEAMNYPLYKYFDEAFLQPFLATLAAEPLLHVQCNESAEEIAQGAQRYTLRTTANQWQSDVVLTTTNVRPNSDLLTEMFACHTDGTVLTDAYLETSQPDVFAVGDLIQVPSQVTETPIYAPLINNALRTGQIAAENLQQKKVTFKGSLKTIGTYLFDWYLASTGLLEADSFLYPNEVAVQNIELTLPLQRKTPIYGKIVYEQASQRILGVQLLSRQNCLEKINTAALAIEQRLTLHDLAQLDSFFQLAFTWLPKESY